MKGLKTLLGITIGIAGLGFAGGAVAISFADNNKIIAPTQADTIYSNIYLVGTINNWPNPSTDDVTGYQFQYDHGENGNHYYTLTVSLTKDTEFKLRDWEEGHNVDYMNSYDGTKVLQGLINVSGNNPNLKCTMTGTYKITYRYTASDNRCIEGFELQSSTRMYYVANNTTWAASNRILLHAWQTTEQGDVNLTNWDGSCVVNKTTAVKVTSNNYDFYAFDIPNNATGFMIKHYDGNTDYKTGNLVPSAGACFTSTGDSDLGSAGAIVADIYSKLGDATYQSTSYSNSICAISSSDRATIVGNYKLLNATAKGYFDNSTLTTYNPNNLSETTSVNYSAIITTLANQSSISLSSRLLINTSSKNTSIIIIAISTVFVASLTAAGFYLLRKKKEQ